jgi:hypothetical protein
MVIRQEKFRGITHFYQYYPWIKEAHSDLSKKLNEELTDNHRSQILGGLYDYSQDLVFLSYTLGEPIETVKKYAEQLIDDVLCYATKTNNDMFEVKGLEWYINCLWYLSFCYFFNIQKEKVQVLSDHISLTGKDWLVDRLIAASIPGHPITVGQLAFPEAYKPLAEALSYDQTIEERTKKIRIFLKNYYPLLKKYDVTWYDSHKEPDPEYCFHTGYWIFELAALSADIGWDDSAFRDHPMYPKDLVDWKFSQRPKDKQIKI